MGFTGRSAVFSVLTEMNKNDCQLVAECAILKARQEDLHCIVLQGCQQTHVSQPAWSVWGVLDGACMTAGPQATRDARQDLHEGRTGHLFRFAWNNTIRMGQLMPAVIFCRFR